MRKVTSFKKYNLDAFYIDISSKLAKLEEKANLNGNYQNGKLSKLF